MDVAALKKRLVVFAALEGAAIVIAAAGFIADIVYAAPFGRGMWIAAIGVAVAAQVWLLLGMRAGKEN